MYKQKKIEIFTSNQMDVILLSYLILKMNANQNTDEFGRDLAFRKTAEQQEYDKFINEIQAKLKVMSWAEYSYELEEEEERQLEEENRVRLEEERVKIAAQAEKLKELISKGEYELEEGEIIE